MSVVIIIVVGLFAFLYVIGSQANKRQAKRIRGQAAMKGNHLSRKDARLAVQEQQRQARAARRAAR
jgi:hypothetical protein